MSKWWLITWSTYGTWLPGDPRGFQTWRGRVYVPPPKRFARPGERTYDPTQYEMAHKLAQQDTEDAVVLTKQQKQTAFDAVVEDIDDSEIVPAILAVGGTHVHLLTVFGKFKIRTMVGRFKAAATRALNDAGFDGKRPWGKGCHMKSKNTRREYDNAQNYIKRHIDEGFLIQQWNVNRKFIPE